MENPVVLLDRGNLMAICGPFVLGGFTGCTVELLVVGSKDGNGVWLPAAGSSDGLWVLVMGCSDGLYVPVLVTGLNDGL